jgi:hypothetical protein
MFPEKLENTPIYEDPDMMNNEFRATLKDTSPEAPTFAYEQPRRNTFARSHLNLRDGGVFGSTTDPYANEDYDLNFHDHDPRGYLTEQPWNEYRRQIESRLRMADFRDDGDYSTTGGGVHPNTLYTSIRNAQNWTKARLKIFDTSYENRHAGGVGIYPHISNVFKSSRENAVGSRGVDEEDDMSMTFEDPEIRQRLTMHLSNVVHGGSRMWRSETTTDHKVKVAAYGKLYSQRGFIPHESQLRILEEDTPWSRMEGSRNAPKNLVKLMATALEGESDLSPGTAAQSARLMYHNAAGAGHGEEQFQGVRGQEAEMGNRSMMLTRDIMALLGFVEQDIKFLESRASDPGKQGKQARRALADLYKMAEVLHATPANVKLEMRNELLLRSGGFGLTPGDGSGGRKTRDQVIVNPKIVKHMDMMVRRMEKPNGDGTANRRDAEGDAENALNKRNHLNGPLFVRKATNRSEENIDFNRRAAESGEAKYKSHTEGKTVKYNNLKKMAQRVERNKRLGTSAHDYQDTEQAPVYKNKNVGDVDMHELMIHAVIDNDFGENQALTRHGGRMGTKDMRRYHTSDHVAPAAMGEASPLRRKNSSSRSIY